MKIKLLSIIAFFLITPSIISQTDSNFTWLVEPKFDIAEDFMENLSRVKLDGKWGFVNTEGQLVVAPLYDSVTNFSNGLAAFLWKNGKWGFVDKTGKNVIYPQFDYVGSFSEGTASALKGHTWGMIDKKGNFIGDPEMDTDGEMLALLAVAQVNEPQKKMSAAMAEKFDMDYVGSYINDLAAASKDGDWGYINQEGKIMIDMVFDEAGNFSNNVARVLQNGKWGYINASGQLIISNQFDEAKDFENDIAFVSVQGKWGIIKKTIETENITNKKEDKRKNRQ